MTDTQSQSDATTAAEVGNTARERGAIDVGSNSPAPNPSRREGLPETRTQGLFDPAWLFLLAGVALLGATVLVSAQAQVDDAAYVRDRALAVEKHRESRIDRYRELLVGIETKQPALVEALASSQLNQIPASRAAIPGTVTDNMANASVFPALEPPPFFEPPRTKIQSRLARLTSNDATRVWLLAGASVLILVGLLPASRK